MSFSSSFGYWTDKLSNGTPLMIDEAGKMAPAPWVPFTRAGCDVGVVAMANMELESTSPDVAQVFGAGSPQAIEAQQHPNEAAGDFEGISVHCAVGSKICAAGFARPDLLPDEPGGYNNFTALYGHQYVAPVIAPNGNVTDIHGKPIPAFPGYDSMTPAVALGYVADMQEAGIPVTYTYIADAHEIIRPVTPSAPARLAMSRKLKAYDAAWAAFFARLGKDGISAQNTLIIVTADEGDHFVGSPPSPPNCDGVTVPCTYAKIGEIDAYLDRLLLIERGVTTPFDLHFDDAPTVYIHGNPGTLDPTTFGLETAMNALVAINPITGNTDRLAVAFGDRAAMQALHMVTADPTRTPSSTLFGNDNYYFLTSSPGNTCDSPIACVSVYPGDAWNHGDLQHEIVTTWLGIVGPGVQPIGVTRRIWSDHTDIRPTLVALAGLRDDYIHDGRLLAEFVTDPALPSAYRMNAAALSQLASGYKQLNAPLGRFDMAAVDTTTDAITKGNLLDYGVVATKLEKVTAVRDALAAEIRQVLEDAEFNDLAVSADRIEHLIDRATAMLQKNGGSARTQARN